MTPEQQSAYAALELAVRMQGPTAVMRPLLANVPEYEGATLTDCPECGQKCWKLENEPDTLPADVVPLCTHCALQAGGGVRLRTVPDKPRFDDWPRPTN